MFLMDVIFQWKILQQNNQNGIICEDYYYAQRTLCYPVQHFEPKNVHYCLERAKK